MSRRRSRSGGFIGGREALRREDLVWRGTVGWVVGCVGRDGRVEGRWGMECRPMYENWVFMGVVEGSSEAEFVRALRKVRMADLLDKTG